MSQKQPLACVMGDMDLVRPLGLAGIPCAPVARRGSPACYSRFTRAVIEAVDGWANPGELLARLLRFGAGQEERPVLFFEEDAYLLLVSRHRRRLGELFRFAIAREDLVENLVDKQRFQHLADRLRLPVPPSRVLPVAEQAEPPPTLGLRFPVILKPVTRRTRDLAPIGTSGTKAVRVDSPKALEEAWPRLAASGMELIAQELVAGPEAAIESYHVYVDSSGEIAGEFTGRKVRTAPLEFGHSTAVETTDSAEVRATGRDLVERLQLNGVAEFEFKRGPDGVLYLLEVNPRCTLWCHVGAVAGVNIPALVYADLAGLPRPSATRARAGVRWCALWGDSRAARESGIPMMRWLPWALGCGAKSGVSLDDPMPMLLSKIWHRLFGLPSQLVGAKP
jgi:predicted ATP-grasp superfamily ATP-dependent carboligase